MFRLLKLRYRRWRLGRRLLREADKITEDEIDRYMAEYQRAHDILEVHRSAVLLDQAASLDIESPKQSDESMWLTGSYSKVMRHLSPKGRFYLRQLIDAEKARRFEVRTLWITKFWIPLLTAAVGIIGALTGLFAILRHAK